MSWSSPSPWARSCWPGRDASQLPGEEWTSGMMGSRHVDFTGKHLRNGVWTKCQPDKMPTGQNANLGWHFVRDFFSVVGILSGPTFWLAFCPDHLNIREWGGPVTSFCLLLTVVGEKVDNFLLLSWSGENFAVFDHHHLPWITLPPSPALAFCCQFRCASKLLKVVTLTGEKSQ